MLAESVDEEEIVARVAALDIGKAELVCCVRLPGAGGAKRRLQEVSTHSTMTRSLGDLANHLVGAGVFRAARLRNDRSARVPVVVADHEVPSLGQQPAEALLPPEHRSADAHDQKDGRVGRTAERLRTELDAVRLDHPLGHFHASSRSGGSVMNGGAPVPTDRGDALAASGGSANAIAFPSGSGTFTWRTPVEYVSIGSCSMPWAARRSRSASSPATARVIRPAPRPRRVRFDEEPGVHVDFPQHLFPDATVLGPAEEPRVPIDARVEIGYRNTGEEVGDRAQYAALSAGPGNACG
jgi:hypothetical protein